MKKPARIIPFPSIKDSKCQARDSGRPVTAADGMTGRAREISDSASPVNSVTNGPSPPIQELVVLMNDHCDVLLEATQTLAQYLEKGDGETAISLQAIWSRCNVLKGRYFNMIGSGSSAAVELNFIFRTIVTLDMAIDCTKITAGHILTLRQPADRFMLEMAAENKISAKTLKRGFHTLTTNPLLTEQDALTASRARYNAEKIYRRALAELVEDDAISKARNVARKGSTLSSNIFGLLKRREIYHDLAKSAKRFSWVANNLREIASHLSAGTSSTMESTQ